MTSSTPQQSGMVLNLVQRDAMRESVGYIVWLEGERGGTSLGQGSAVRLAASARILAQLGWEEAGHRDSYPLEVDEEIANLMREWVGRLTDGGEAIDPDDQPMIDAGRFVAATFEGTVV
jgi:hypothetical protein